METVGPCTTNIEYFYVPTKGWSSWLICLVIWIIQFCSATVKYDQCETWSMLLLCSTCVGFVILLWKLNKVIQSIFNPNSNVISPLLKLSHTFGIFDVFGTFDTFCTFGTIGIFGTFGKFGAFVAPKFNFEAAKLN